MKIVKVFIHICLIFFINVLMFLIIGEILVRIYVKTYENYDMAMWRYVKKGITILNKDGLTHINKAGVYFENLYGVKVKINSKGLRDKEYTYEKNNETYRIIVMGNSITFGWGVEQDLVYTEIIERELNNNSLGKKYEVINLGVCNYQLQQELLFLKTEGIKYRPDLIIYPYFIRDAKFISRISYNNVLRNSYLLSFLKSKLMIIDSKYNKKSNFRYVYKNLYKENSIEKKNFDANIVELQKFTKENNIPLLVVLIPELHNLRDYPFVDIHNYVKSKFTEEEVIDVLPFFDKQIDPEKYWVSLEDAHPNEFGHKIIAGAILKELRKRFQF